MQNGYIEQLQNKLRLLENENRMLREIIEWNDIDIPDGIPGSAGSKTNPQPKPAFNPKPTVKYASEPMHAPEIQKKSDTDDKIDSMYRLRQEAVSLPDVSSFSTDKNRTVTDPMEVISTINGKYSSKGAENNSPGLSMLDNLSRRFSTQSFLAGAEAMSNERILSQESIFESAEIISAVSDNIAERDMPAADSDSNDILNMLLNDSLDDDDDILFSDEDDAYLDNAFKDAASGNNNDNNNDDDDGIFW